MAEQDHDSDRAARGTPSVANNGFDPVEEDRYWRDNYIRRPYADETLSYDHYRPAYRYGWESRARLDGQRWDQVERELERGWRQNRGASRLGWGDAKLAARDAWQRIDHRIIDAREAGRGPDGNVTDTAGTDTAEADTPETNANAL
jgi:hypothetical protein